MMSTSFMSTSRRTLVAIVLASLMVVPALAQGRQDRRRPQQRPQPPKIQTDPFGAVGTVQAVGPDRIQILTNTEQDWMVWIAANAKVQVTGTAEADFLTKGMFIRFVATVDKKGYADAPVEELMLFTPSQLTPVGAWPEGFEPKPQEGQDDPAVGMQGDQQPPVETSTYTVAGQITSIRKELFIVNSGNGIVRFKLAEKPKIKVDFADFTVAKPGDKIDIKRGKMIRGLMGRAEASELTIVLSKPLINPRRKPAPKPKPTPKPKPGEEDAGEEDAGEKDKDADDKPVETDDGEA